LMRGISAEGLADSVARVEKLAGSGDAATLGSELFAVADLLGHEAALRRALTDPSASRDARQHLVRAIFDGKLGSEAIEVVATAAGSRWSSASDFMDAVEQLAALSLVIASERAGELSELEDELFRFGRVILGDPRLRDAITNRQVPAEHRQALVRSLLEGKASDSAVTLAVHAVASRQRSVELALENYQQVAAERRQRLIAVVRSAIALTEDQRDRLTAALGKLYGTKIQLNVVVDPEVIGGVRVELGDDVIDGSVSARLDEAARRLTGRTTAQ
jgi:F-type H+-transporting ATPase subunit delta